MPSSRASMRSSNGLRASYDATGPITPASEIFDASVALESVSSPQPPPSPSRVPARHSSGVPPNQYASPQSSPLKPPSTAPPSTAPPTLGGVSRVTVVPEGVGASKKAPAAYQRGRATMSSGGGKSGGLKTTSDLVRSSVLLAPPEEFRADSLFWTSFEAIEECSTGGNGIWRPYGRFVAGRQGDGLAVWERSALPRALGRSPTRHYHQELNLFETERRMAGGSASGDVEGWGPSVSSGEGEKVEQAMEGPRSAGGSILRGVSAGSQGPGRNVTAFNVENRMYNSRLWKPQRITVKSKLNFRGVDVVQKFAPLGFQRPGPMFSPRQYPGRPMPAPSAGARPSATNHGGDSNRSAGGSDKPSTFTATFLTEVPESRKVPANLRVGTGRGTEQQFLNNPKFDGVYTLADRRLHERLEDHAVLDPVAAERLPQMKNQYNFGRVSSGRQGIVVLPQEHTLPRRGYQAH